MTYSDGNEEIDSGNNIQLISSTWRVKKEIIWIVTEYIIYEISKIFKWSIIMRKLKILLHK